MTKKITCSNCGKDVDKLCSSCWRCEKCCDCKIKMERTVNGTVGGKTPERNMGAGF